jgi:isopentenyl-diphosphate delta-isomerase type 1
VSELFETFNDAGEPTGLAPRDQVHRTGLWHRATNVFIFDHAGRLLLQQRSASKDVWPNAWDLSVGEHLTPGEDFEAAAQRGLGEELGIEPIELTPLGSVVRATIEIAELGVLDRELQQSFRGRWDGPVTPCPEEVAAVRWVTVPELKEEIEEDPEPWLRSGLDLL